MPALSETILCDRNILIRGLTVKTDKFLNTVSALRGIPKWDVIREALEEYSENHRKEVSQAIAGGKKTS